MGYRMVKHLESAGYNRKLFYLDRGATDLPPINNMTDIQPGSEARSLTTGEKWILNSKYLWVWIGEGDCCCTGGAGGSNGGSGNEDGDVPVPGEEPTIEGITIAPQNITVGLGATISFMATVAGNAKLNRAVDWSIKGQNNVNTKITSDGILTVDEGEKSKTITVRATSQADKSIYAQAIVTIDPEMEEPTAPIVTAVVISPREVEVIRGRSVMFSAQVNGANITDKSVTWSVSGHEGNNTSIDENGILKVGTDETARLVVVKAVSNLDSTVFDSTTITTIPETEASNPVAVTKVTIIPETARVGQGYSTKLAATVAGVNNPPQDVTWQILGAVSATTRITPDGQLYIGADEAIGLLTVLARSTFAPDVYGEADIEVLDASDPEVQEEIKQKTVSAVIINPSSIEVPENTLKIFTATVIGNNDPSQAVKWKLEGAETVTTYCTDQGVVIIGKGETAKSLMLTATSVQDPTKSAQAYIKITQATFEPTTGIADVPKSPLGQKYLRERSANGEAVWTPVADPDNGPTDPTPEIRDIVVTPEAVTVRPGSTIQYVAEFDVIGDLSTEVTWSIKGQKSEGTYISQDGILRIAEDETSKLITVKAVSVLDKSKSGMATVAVDPEAPEVELVTAIQVVPANATVIRGRSILLQAIVTGINLKETGVSWSLVGNNNEDTRIEDGMLYTSEVESTSIVIATATSVLDATKMASAVISIIPEELAPEVWKIESITVLPEGARVGQGFNNRFFAVVNGVNNPPQEVRWILTEDGGAQSNTHITSDGVLYVDPEENVGARFQIRAQSVFEPSVISDPAEVEILSKDDPEAQETVIKGISITPAMVEAGKNSQITFRVVVLGQNNPSQEVKFTLSGNTSAKTVISALGVLTIAADEASKVLIVKATSVVDQNYFINAYVTINEALSLPDTGIPDIPEAPLEQSYVRTRDKSGKAMWEKTPDDIPLEPNGADYVRTRDAEGKPGWKEVVVIEDVPEDAHNKQFIRTRDENGKAQWQEVTIEGGGRGGYQGTFENYGDLMSYEVPEDAHPGDYAIVASDVNHQNYPAIYVLDEDMNWVFDVVLGRPFILGDKLDVLYVLDNEVHSQYLRDIEQIADFDTTEKRWELAESESAWKLVTELHPGFWNMIRRNPDHFKALVAMDRKTGNTKLYLTCFLDNHEFVIPFPDHYPEGAKAIIEEEIINPEPAAPDTLSWTNTIQNGNMLVAMNSDQYIRYEFDWDSFTLTVKEQTPVESEEEPGVSPWATVVGEYTYLKNGEVVGPLKDVTDTTGYLWVANRESFMIGSAGDGTQMFCYNIDDDTYFIFDVPRGAKKDYHFATDLNERYFMFWISQTSAVWGDRKTQETKIITWKPTGYSGLSEPGEFTRPSVSIDGKLYYHTSTQANTPQFSAVSFDSGDFYAQAPQNGQSASAIGLNDGKRVMSNSPDGLINIYTDNGRTLDRTYYNTPEGSHYYVVVPTGRDNQLLFVKVNDKAPSSGPVWFIFDPDQITADLQDHSTEHDGVIACSTYTDKWCEQTNPQGKGCAYRMETDAGFCYLLTFATEKDAGLLVQYDEATQQWTEHDMPFGGLGNDSHSYNQPGLLDGTIIMTTDSDGNLHGYDVVNHTDVDVSEIDPGGHHGENDSNFVQIDDTHFAWCTDEGITLYRMTRNGDFREILKVPEHQGIVHGFG